MAEEEEQIGIEVGKDISSKRKAAGKKGLALSGGGYRAGLFHLGALWRLNELGWLRKLDEITSVSGGSIVAAYLGMLWSELGFDEKGVARNFLSAFIEPMRTMFGTTIDVQTIAKGLLNPVGSVRRRVSGTGVANGLVGLLGEAAEILGGSASKSMAKSLARPLGALFASGIDAAATAWDAFNPFPTPVETLIATYDRLLFHGKTLRDLPDASVEGNPRFTLYATNMQTGVSVRMTREYLADWRIGKVDHPDIPLARAVAASSGFPPLYSPVEIRIPLDRWRRNGAELFERKELREQMDLADGAVYDNMGLTTLLINCQTVLVSDAGEALGVLDTLSFEWLSQVVRTLLVAMDQSNKLRYGRLIRELVDEEREGTYWGISQPIKDSLGDELQKDSARTRALGAMRTRLNRFSDEEQEDLINWGYALADARMRRWVNKEAEQGILPYPGRLQ